MGTILSPEKFFWRGPIKHGRMNFPPRAGMNGQTKVTARCAINQLQGWEAYLDGHSIRLEVSY